MYKQKGWSLAILTSVSLLGGRKTDSATELVYARQSFVTIVKSFGLQAIDLVSINYQGEWGGEWVWLE